MKTTFMGYYGKFVHNLPKVFVEYDVGPLLYGRSYMKQDKGLEGILAPLRYINYEGTLIKGYNKVMTVTKKDKKILEMFFPSASVISVETGVDLDVFPYQYADKGKKNLVYLGHYRHFPNEDAVLYFVNKIFPIIKMHMKNVTFTVVGSNPTRAINRLKERDDIIVTGTVENVREYLIQGTVFIAPIRLGCGIKGKLLEAMAVGLPIVATSVAAAGIGVKNKRDILIADTAYNFAHSVLSLFRDQELRNKISLNARRIIEQQYDWKIVAERIAQVFQDLLEGN